MGTRRLRPLIWLAIECFWSAAYRLLREERDGYVIHTPRSAYLWQKLRAARKVRSQQTSFTAKWWNDGIEDCRKYGGEQWWQKEVDAAQYSYPERDWTH